MLTMVISLIPSTLVTTAFAADAAGNGVDITDVQDLDDNKEVIETTGVYRIDNTRSKPVKITTTDAVVLVLNNVNITTATSPIELADKANVTLVVLDGTNNTLTCTAKAADNSNGGKTAGILVPKTATLTIDKQVNGKGNGELTVNAGVGGAGIGGGAGTGFIEERAANGQGGNMGSTGSGAYTYGDNNKHYATGGTGGTGGQGGQGGRTGGAGGTLGTLTINAGVLNITGGTNAAGIGGGVGGTGENGGDGQPGANGSQGGKYAGESGTWLYMAAGGGGGNGGGGAGGNGGTGGCGGNGGRVNITGGSVTVTGGNGAPDIGGGNGGSNGQGGIGGASNTYCDFGAAGATYDFDNPNQRAINYFSNGRMHVVRRVNAGGAGGQGADGNDGLEGSGGTGAIVNITGGIVSLTHKTVSGGNIGKKITRDNRKGSTAGGVQLAPGNRRSHTENYTSQTILDYDSSFGLGGQGGNGGAATTLVGTPLPGNAGTLKISGKGQQNMKFLSEYNASVSARPMSQNNTPLYRAVITAVDANNNETPVEGAVASITKDDVTYNNVSDNNGAITLWLPLGSYTLKHANVIHDSIGWMREPAELQVTNKDNATATAKLGVNLVFTVNKKVKAYTNGTDTPVTLKMDATMVQEANVTGSVRWFREPFQKDDAANDTTYRPTTFDVGYDEANQDDKGELTKANEKLFELPISENGRYWAEITMNMGEDDFKVVRLVEVKNIYREFKIKTRTREMTRDGKEKYTSDYEALKNANGTLFEGQYGFPWDLNGYNAADISAGTLLTGVDYDTVSICALSSKVKWYNAAIGNHDLNKNATKTAFEPVSLTLDAEYLANNKYVDSNTNGAEYTITYTPEGVPVAEVTIRGIVQNDDGSEKTQLWSITNSFPENVTEADIEGWPQAGYRIDKVLVDGTDKTNDLKDGVIHLTNMSGTEEHNYADAVQKVEFVYVNNMTDVTVKALYKGTNTPVEGFTAYKTPMEIGTKVDYAAPRIDGFTCVGSTKDKDGNYTVVQDGEITYYYTKNTGNVTYKAVDENGVVIWTKDGKVDNDHAPDTNILPNNTDDAVLLSKYGRKEGDTAKIVDAKGDTVTTYDGVNDLTVTYTYVRKTRDIIIKQIDRATGTVINTTTQDDNKVGEYVTITAPTKPDDYTLTSKGTQLIYVDPDNSVALEAEFYYKVSVNATITIKLYASDEDKTNDKPFNTMTLSSTYGEMQTVDAPSVTGWELKAGENVQVKLTPKKGDADSCVAKFVYDAVYDDITVELTGVDRADLPADWKSGSKTFQVQRGQGFTITAPSIVNYKLADGQALEQSLSAEKIKENHKKIAFNYVKAEADLITITVKGVKDGTVLYSYTKDVRKSATDVEIQVFTMNGCKLDNVEMGGTPVTATDGPYKINPQGTAQTVTATYSSNMADVTINAYYKDTTTTVEGFTPFKVKAEIGKPYSYGALAIPGYDNDGAAPSIANVKEQGNVLNYYFTKQTGNVVYQLVEDGHADHILATKSETVAKGATIDAAAAKAPTATNWKLADGQTEGEVVGAVDGKFDGVHAVTVTYKAVPKTKDVTIVRYDVDTNQTIPLTTEEQNVGKTLTATLATGKMHTLQKADYLPAGYTISGKDAVEVYVEDDEEARTVNMYFRRSTDEDVTVNLVYTDAQNQKQTIQTYLVQRKPGTTITVKAPDMAYKGYTAKKNSVDVQPTQNSVEIEYTVTYYDIKIKLLDENDRPLNTPADYKTDRKVRKGEGIVLTAPSIADYTLTSALVVSKTATELDQATNRTITFKYKNTAAANYVTHTIKLMDASKTPATLITQYNSVVTKGNGKTTYLAPLQDGYQVDKKSQEISNAASKDVVFNYTKSAATITIHFVDTNGVTLNGYENGQRLTGYEKGQTVMITAPAVSGKALAGLYNATAQGDKVTPLTGVTTTVTIPKDQPNVEVTFAYKEQGTYKFHLVDQAGTEIKTVTGENGTFSTKTGGNLDLTDSGWKFDHANNNNTAPFNTENAELTIGDDTTVKEYTLYYTRMTRPVTYKYVDVTDGQNKNINFTGTTNNPQTTNVGENLITSAPQIPGYTPNALRNVTFVKTGTDAVTVTFEYIKKATGSITVVHKLSDSDKVITSYTVSGSVGEWFTATKLATNAATGITADGKYKFTESNTNQATQSVQYTAAAQTLTFVYEPNYVTVNTYISVDGAETEYQTGIDVVKTTGTQKLYAPSKTGYVLKGITVKKNVVQLEDGSATTFPDYWNNNELTLTNLTSNVKVVYYYEKINDNIKDYQATITVKDQYETYGLGGRTETVIKDVNAEIASKAYDGYALIAYQIGDSADQKKQVEADKANNFKLIHKFDKNTTVTFFYGRADGSAVVPGGDMNFGTDDDVIIKPKDDNKPSVNPDGSVNVPNGAEVVTPNGTVLPPHGSIVKPDGTIVAPGTDGTTKPGITIDPSNPSDNGKYIFVQYKANGGVGESYTQMVKKDADTVELKSVASLFTRKGYTATGWNTNDKGLGDSYTAGSNRINKNLVLYAQWKADEVPSGTYTAKVVLKSNGASDQPDVEQTIASDTANPILATLQANPFTVKTNLAGWTFRGWNTEVNGTGIYYADQGTVSVDDKGTLPLYAQWAKTGTDGSITVPGKDNIPGTDNDVTVKPGNGGQLKRDDATGTITVPNGGSAVKKDNEIDMPNGGTVKPDGEILIKQPDGTTIVVKPDGTIETGDPTKTAKILTYKSGVTDVKDVKVYFTDKTTVKSDVMTREGYKLGQWLKGDVVVAIDSEIKETTDLTAKWFKVDADGAITVPGKDGAVDAPQDKDNVTVKPGADGKLPSVDENGNVKVPEGGTTVVTPDGSVVVPGGSIVEPDGTIKDDQGTTLYPTKGEDGLDKTPTGYIKVTYKSGIAGVQDYVQLVKGTEVDIITNNVFGDVPNKTFLYWNGANGKEFTDTTVTADTILTAQWKDAGSVILSVADGSKVKTVNVAGIDENVLIMSGKWTEEAEDVNYTIPVLVDGKPAAGDLRWYVDAKSYVDKFGFTDSVLTGDDIIAINAQSGEIRVKNSGIVRVSCESVTDSSIKLSFVLVVPGDITQDGLVDMDDVDYAAEFATDNIHFTDSAADAYRKLLGDMDASNAVDLDDIDYLIDIATYLKEI